MRRVTTLVTAAVTMFAIAVAGTVGSARQQPRPLEDIVRDAVSRIDTLERLKYTRYFNDANEPIADLGSIFQEGRLRLGPPGPRAESYHVELSYGGLDVKHLQRTAAFIGKTRGRDGGTGYLSLNASNGRQSVSMGDGAARFFGSNGQLMVYVGVGTQANRERGVVRVNGRDVSDYAELFELATRAGVVPGTVMSISPRGSGIEPAAQPYDARVVGVISGAGGLQSGMQLGGRRDNTDDLPIAMAGQVYVRTTLEGGPIAAGDLLVSSSRHGTAMRAADRGRALGAVIGKAIEPVDRVGPDGEALVRILVMNR